MLTTLIKKVLGSRNERTLRRMQKSVVEINALESSMQALTDEELAAKTESFRVRLKNNEGLDALLPEAFAVVRETSVRTLNLRHFDVQLIGGMVLHEGNIAEMGTGEGKTLTATLAAYLNAIEGRGVHVVTVNDYLAKRDSEWMNPVFSFLGLSVDVIHGEMTHPEKQAAYSADILYGTNNEFGFDYLRDNMAFSPEDKVQRELNFAIVDEVDSILIDEARTPLIISGAAEDSSALYLKVNQLIPKLVLQPGTEDASDSEVDTATGDYTVDEKQKQVHLTETGHQHIETLLHEAGLLEHSESLYHANNIVLMHHVNAGLRAHVMFHRDVDYIVQNKQVVIVDEHTGRTMPGRRWSEGLHQAVEAKEGVPIENENQTLASITFQNFFRIYDKLSGMTGTADTEAYEFQQIYNLEVVAIPTNKPMVRINEPDLVYLTQPDKYQAVIEDIRDCVKRKQPVLVGTASIEASEHLHQLLKKEKIKHQVLNAKFHEKEAHIIAEAGRPGAVTIATNMAGRGTDIVLGGSLKTELDALPEDASEADRDTLKNDWQERNNAVIQAGGLRIISSERHESRRIDNQLRGRSGRQGDPGSSRFYLSLDDNLMRIFASERVASMMKKLGMKPGEPIEHSLVSKAIENAQRKLEGHHFDVRKQLLSYDNVANEQRKVMYSQRAEIMEMDDTHDVIIKMITSVIESLIDTHLPPNTLEDQWDIDTLSTILNEEFKVNVPLQAWLEEDHHIQPEQIKARAVALAMQQYQAKEDTLGREMLSQFEKSIMLQSMDHHWREHLASMDYLRQGIHLRGYAQKDPKQEYKREAFELFTSLLNTLKFEIVKLLLSVEVAAPEDVDAVEEKRRAEHDATSIRLIHSNEEVTDEATEEKTTTATFRRDPQKVGRNDPCPCGSNKKYKVCHGKLV
ncbi:MAG: preprotein translocase subunit SecA [Legionellaceae bacterium]|nr:preprotein translocase subunit SecA [Legionellaceae bacterium]